MSTTAGDPAGPAGALPEDLEDGSGPGVGYWRRRAEILGARAVVNVDHPEDADLGDVTDGHRRELWPLLRAELRGDERIVLDVGCGTGRLTADLAELVGGRAIGVDPVAELLELARPHGAVELRRMTEGLLPVDDDAVDVVFTSLVLGGIDGDALRRTAAEMRRVLRPGGLVFVSESLADRPDAGAGHWAARTVEDYVDLLPWAALAEVGRFDDAGDTIAVLAGRG